MNLRPLALSAILFAMTIPVFAGDASSEARLHLSPLDQWLRGPIRIEVSNEVSGVTFAFDAPLLTGRAQTLDPLGLKVLGAWARAGEGVGMEPGVFRT